MAYLSFPSPTQLKNLSDPSSDSDAATKVYVDNSLGGGTSTIVVANVTATGNVTGNIVVSNTITANSANLGNLVESNYFSGNGSYLTSITGANITGIVGNATHANYADVANSVSGSNVSGAVAYATTANSVAGANVSGAVSYATTANSVAGANVSGAVAYATTANSVAGANVSGTVSSATTAGTVTTAAQPNITSVGTLSSLAVTGNITSGNANLGNLVTANFFSGDGGYLSNLQISTASVANANYANYVGTVINATQSNITTVGTLTNLDVSGNVVIGGNLTVNGTVTSINSTIVEIDDLALVLANDATTATQANGAGIIINGASANMLYVSTTNAFTFSHKISADGGLLSNITGANVTGTVSNASHATVADSANSVSGANVSGAVAYATTANSVAGANVSGAVSYATTANSVAGANVSGAVGLATYATTANAVAGANVSGEVAYANVANNVAGANVSGAVAYATTANSVAGANVTGQVGNALVAGTVYTAAQPNITSVGNLTSLFVGNATSNVSVSAGNITATGNITANKVSAHTGYFESDLTVLGNLDAQVGGIIYANSSIIYGNLDTGEGALYVGVPGFTPLPNTIVQVGANINNYAQFNFENTSDGNVASTDIVITPDNGTDTDYYLAMGVAGSNWDGTQDNSLGDAVHADDGYLYVQGDTTSGNVGNLVIGTSVANTALKLVAGGIGNSNVRAIIDASGVNVIGTVTAQNAHFTGSNVFLGDVANVKIGGGTSGYILQTDGAGNIEWVDNLPSTVTYNANSLSLTGGAYVSGNVACLQSFGDYGTGNVYVLTDGTGSAPAWQVDIDFISVASFNRVVLNINYTQASGHTIYVQLYNNTTSAWDSIGSYTGLGSYYGFALEVIDGAPYINGSGKVQLKLYHSNAGNSVHQTSIDYVALELSSQGPQGPRGPTGSTGATGPGVATGGTTGQVLIKNSGTNYDTAWSSDLSIGNVTASNIKSDHLLYANGTSYTIASFTNDSGYITTSALSTYATQTDVSNAVANLVNSAPSALDTLNELATALGNDASYSTTITNALANKLSTTAFTSTADTWLATKTTTNVTEGTNLYYTVARANTAIDNRVTTSFVTGLGANANVANVALSVAGANVTGEVGYAAVANSVAVANVTGIGNIATINKDGNASNILYGNGVFAAAPVGSGYGDSNVTTLLASYGSNTITTTGNVTVGNIIGNGQALTGLTGANVTGQVGNALVAGTVYTAAQPNITSVGTLTSLSVTGNVTSGNIKSDHLLYANGTAYSIASFTNDSGYITSSALSTYATQTDVSNAVANLVNSAPSALDTLQELANALGNDASYSTTITNALANKLSTTAFSSTADTWLATKSTTNLPEGANLYYTVARANTAIDNRVTTSFVDNLGANANVANTANSVAGANVTGQVGNALVAGTVYTAAQPNITSVGTLSSLTVTANITAGNVVTDHIYYANGVAWSTGGGSTTTPGGSNTYVQFNDAGSFGGNSSLTFNKTTGTLAATIFSGAGNNLSNIQAANVTGQVGNALVAGTVYTAAQPNITSVGTLTSVTVTGNANVGNLNATDIYATGNITGTGGTAGSITGANLISANFFTGNIYTSSQPYINSLGTLTGLTFVANGNITMSGSLSQLAGANVVSANYIAGTLTYSDQPNITRVGTLANLIAVNANITTNLIASNLTVGNTLIANANLVVVGNITSSTGTNANVNIDPDGTGKLVISSTTPVVIGNTTTFSNDIIIASGNITTPSGSNADINIDPDGTGNLNVAASTPVIIANSLSVTGNISVSGNIVDNSGDLSLLTGSGSNGNITLVPDGTGRIILDGMQWPVTDGSNGFVLKTDGSGNLSWTAMSGGSGGGGSGSMTIVDDTSTNGTFYPVWANVSSGNLEGAFISTTKFQFNPSSGQLTVQDINTLSDSTLKTNPEPIEDPMSILRQLFGMGFNWADSGKKSYGLMAQMLEKVLPELVGTNAQGLKTVNYIPIIAFLIEAVKRQQDDIDALKAPKKRKR